MNTNLDHTYDAYHLSLQIKEKDDEITQASGKAVILNKVAIVAVVAFLVLAIIVFLLRG